MAASARNSTVAGGKSAAECSGQELGIERVLDAPRQLVWKAWTDPGQLMRRRGPKGFTSPACTIDLRPGGKYLNCMRSPDGQDGWSTGRYLEVAAPKRLVYTDSFADAEGNVVPASHCGIPSEWPMELQVTVTFEEHEGRTRLTLRHAGFPAGEGADQAGVGWNEAPDKLAESLR